MNCPDCDTDLGDSALGRFKCPGCHTVILSCVDKPIRTLNVPLVGLVDKVKRTLVTEPVLCNGIIGTRERVKAAQPIQVPYMHDGNVTVNCAVCNLPHRYMDSSRAIVTFLDMVGRPEMQKFDKEKVSFTYNRATDKLTAHVEVKPHYFPRTVKGMVCSVCLHDPSHQVKHVDGSVRDEASAKPTERLYARSKTRSTRQTVFNRPHRQQRRTK